MMDKTEGPSIKNVVPPPPPSGTTHISPSSMITFSLWNSDDKNLHLIANYTLSVLPRIGEAISIEGKHFRVKNIVHVINDIPQIWAKEY